MWKYVLFSDLMIAVSYFHLIVITDLNHWNCFKTNNYQIFDFFYLFVCFVVFLYFCGKPNEQTDICQPDMIFVHFVNGIELLLNYYYWIIVAVNDVNFQIVRIMLQGQVYSPAFIDASN